MVPNNTPVPVSSLTGSLAASAAVVARADSAKTYRHLDRFMGSLYTVYVQSTMILRVDSNSSIPVYRQIVDGVRILLVNGELAPGDQLPPVRRLALDLGVHFNTVAEAYRTLEEEGW